MNDLVYNEVSMAYRKHKSKTKRVGGHV